MKQLVPWILAAVVAVPSHGMMTMDFAASELAADSDPDYAAGQSALDAGRWADAAQRFAAAAARGGPEADAATYWQAYAEKRQGRKAEALELLGKLHANYPKSAWLDDAKALEVELRGSKEGKPVGGRGRDREDAELSEDDELKLYALNSLLANDSPRAVELLRQFLAADHPRKLHEQALFVLSQSDEPAARQVVVEIARGQKRPELREKAIEMLGISGDPEDIALLAELYSSVSDPDIKRKVLDSYLIADEEERVYQAATTERDPELRRHAINLLGAMNATGQLRELYKNETDPEVKRALLDGLFVAGDIETLSRVARTDPDPEMRIKAIHGLGVSGEKRSANELKDIYRVFDDIRVRQAVIEAFFIQDNAPALVELARSEKNPQLRREALQRLSLMDSPEATEFLMKILQ